MKKYLIRIAGAVCLLAVIATVFLLPWLQISGVKRKEFRKIRDSVETITEELETKIDDVFSSPRRKENFADLLKDNDLPSSKSKIKAQIREFKETFDKVCDTEVSLGELLEVSIKAPGMIGTAGNILQDDELSHFYVDEIAKQVIEDLYNNDDYIYDAETYAEKLISFAENKVEAARDFSFAFVAVSALLILIILFCAACAITHICNKARWLKYILLAFTVLFTIGTCVALPLLSSGLSDTFGNMQEWSEISLQITAAPFVSVILAAVPMVLDIIFERKRRERPMEG